MSAYRLSRRTVLGGVAAIPGIAAARSGVAYRGEFSGEIEGLSILTARTALDAKALSVPRTGRSILGED